MNKKKRFEESGVRENVRTLFQGFRRVLCGAAIAALIAVAADGFTKVPGESGYMAVLYFASSVAFLALALRSMWVIGGGKKRAGTFEK